MSKNAKRSLLTLILSLALIGGTVHAGTRIVKEFDLAPGGDFVLDTAQGGVELVGTAGSTAKVVIISRMDDLDEVFDFVYDVSPGRVGIEVKKRGSLLRSWFDWGRGDRLKFEIEVPYDTRVDLDTSGGSLTVEGIERDVRLDTSGGAIKAYRIGGRVSADTSGGSIVVEDAGSDVEADTSGGGIRIENVRGDVNADTSGGSIDISDVSGEIYADTSGGGIRISEAGGRVFADTSGGSVSVSFVPGNHSGGELSTSGGGLRVALDPAANLNIDASSSGGGVTVNLPITVQGKISKSHVRGRLGSGGAVLKLRASGGGIKIDPM